MSEFARSYVAPAPKNVKVGAYVLCEDCSKAIHTTYHSAINPCQCDLCSTKETL